MTVQPLMNLNLLFYAVESFQTPQLQDSCQKISLGMYVLVLFHILHPDTTLPSRINHLFKPLYAVGLPLQAA